MKSTQINNQNSVQIEPNQPSRKELNQPFKENMLENKQEFTSNPSGGGSSSPPPPPHYNEEKPKQPQQTDFMDYLDFYFKKEYKLLLKKDPAKIEEIKKYLTELEKEGQTKCLNCFQTFSREKDQDEFDECLVKNICLECQVKKEKKITGEWREFQQKLGMPVEELPKTWWGELSPHLALIAFSALIFCGWNKFYAWYEKPLTEEWGWEDEKDDEDEKKIKKQADTEKKTLVEETPVPKTRWEKVKNWPQNNKVKTLALIMIIVNLVFLLVKMRKFNV